MHFFSSGCISRVSWLSAVIVPMVSHFFCNSVMFNLNFTSSIITFCLFDALWSWPITERWGVHTTAFCCLSLNGNWCAVISHWQTLKKWRGWSLVMMASVTHLVTCGLKSWQWSCPQPTYWGYWNLHRSELCKERPASSITWKVLIFGNSDISPILQLWWIK